MAMSGTEKESTEKALPSISEQVNHYLKIVQDFAQLYLFTPLLILTIALLLTGNYSLFLKTIFLPVFKAVLNIFGVAIGVGLGLGLALHVYDQLQDWHHADQQTDTAKRTMSSSYRSVATSKIQSSFLDNEQTYNARMTAAGYPPPSIQRGQISRTQLQRYYTFDNSLPLEKLNTFFPNVTVNIQLAKWIDIIMRDFISSWYTKLDNGIVYPPTSPQTKDQNTHRILNSIARYRSVPFLDNLYDSLAIVFGNIATRFEHVNILEVALLHWTKVVAHTFQTYRQIRKHVKSNNEMAIAKEFLIANKVHPAVVYGLDVPSLLFADADAKECKDAEGNQLEILEQRLFPIMKECELDYNRVISNRMVKALLARHDAACPMLQGLLTEILASCVLNPIFGLFAPETVNGWLIMGLGKSADESKESEDESLELIESEDLDTAKEEKEQSMLESEQLSPKDTGEDLLTQLSSAIIELRAFVDFDEYREGEQNHSSINWDDPVCRTAVLRLVLIIEAVLSDGRCVYEKIAKDATDDMIDETGEETEVSIQEYEPSTLSQVLMEMTSDADAFEVRIAEENASLAEKGDKFAEMTPGVYERSATEQSTIRTLIAAWLHSGQVYRMLSLMSQAQATILLLYYEKKSFLRSQQNCVGFLRQLKALEGVDVIVDTMAALASPRLDEGHEALHTFVQQSTSSMDRSARESAITSAITSQFMTSSPSTPRYCDFHRNEAFASSLRSERERRVHSWESRFENDNEEGVPIIIHAGATEKHRNDHKELHRIAKMFYSGTITVSLRDAGRRTNSTGTELGSLSEGSEAESTAVSLLTVEAVGPTRRIEVPDDDSSFLLRAQARALNAVGVHRDQRNHEHSYRCFAASYEEPIVRRDTDHYVGARFVRKCQVRYYPIDRTATVVLDEEQRKLDQRRKSSVPDTIKIESKHAPLLSSNFLKERHLCQRWNPRGTSRSQPLLASNIMEPTDFTSVPRNGKAIDFVYRMTFFEKPMIDLGGKHFTLHDASSIGAHRADASALELSDATLSAALIMLTSRNLNLDSESSNSSDQKGIEMGKDGYPVLWMRSGAKQENGPMELKPIRLSFIRAALLVTSARQEARFQSLLKCVKAGSAKLATRAMNDAQLKPVVRLLEYSSNASREKQSLILRDLKLGVNHIDRDQLRRNGLFNPRYPTYIKDLQMQVEDVLSSEDIKDVYLHDKGAHHYKIRCTALVELIADGSEMQGDLGYRFNGRLGSVFKEEWIVYRSFKEFQTLHKHLKNQVSSSESSGTAGSRLVGAASAALSTGASPGRHKNRNVLVPSLAQATKIGALGLTPKSLLKRKEYLNGYLEYLSTPGHPLSRCTELLLFVGAFYPFPPDVSVGASVTGVQDPLGRTLMRRMIVEEAKIENPRTETPNPRERKVSYEDNLDEVDDLVDEPDSASSPSKDAGMIPGVRAKIDKVPLSSVRNRLFDLLRYLFGFENASFARNRMLAALKTASFAVTSRTEFRRMLYKIHTEQISSEAIGNLLDFVLNILWPNGTFFTPAPPLTEEEKQQQAQTAKEALHSTFPEALRAILGPELTKDGLDILHEMLQNRLVLRSMTYYLLGIIWNEAFPELSDVLADAPTLDVD